MSAGERAFTLRQAARLLRAGGVLAVADEVFPEAIGERVIHAVLRLPQASIGWLLAGATSHPIPDLPEEIRAAGFAVQREERWLLGRLAAITAGRETRARPEEETS